MTYIYIVWHDLHTCQLSRFLWNFVTYLFWLTISRTIENKISLFKKKHSSLNRVAKVQVADRQCWQSTITLPFGSKRFNVTFVSRPASVCLIWSYLMSPCIPNIIIMHYTVSSCLFSMISPFILCIVPTYQDFLLSVEMSIWISLKKY